MMPETPLQALGCSTLIILALIIVWMLFRAGEEEGRKRARFLKPKLIVVVKKIGDAQSYVDDSSSETVRFRA